MDSSGLLLSSDYPIDKIIGYRTGSVTLTPSSPSTTVTINHGFGYSPLFFVKWSTTPDFQISYDEIGVTFNTIFLRANSDSNNTYVLAGMNRFVNTTLYFRIIYFMPTTVDETAPETQSNLDTFILNTDYLYTKIYDESYIPSSSASITYNLPYIPQIEVWYIRASDGRLVHVVSNDVTSNAEPKVIQTAAGATFTSGSLTPVSGWHYKVYIESY